MSAPTLGWRSRTARGAQFEAALAATRPGFLVATYMVGIVCLLLEGAVIMGLWAQLDMPVLLPLLAGFFGATASLSGVYFLFKREWEEGRQ